MFVEPGLKVSGRCELKGTCMYTDPNNGLLKTFQTHLRNLSTLSLNRCVTSCVDARNRGPKALVVSASQCHNEIPNPLESSFAIAYDVPRGFLRRSSNVPRMQAGNYFISCQLLLPIIEANMDSATCTGLYQSNNVCHHGAEATATPMFGLPKGSENGPVFIIIAKIF